MKLPVLIIGGGGHAKVLIEAMRLRSITILGIIDSDPAKIGAAVSGVRIIGDDRALSGYDSKALRLVNGIGSIHKPSIRMAVFKKLKEEGFSFATIIHPSAVIASDAVLGEGAQIMAGVVIQPGVTIGTDTIVNTRASIDHDCQIGDHVHLAPGVTMSGGVKVGNGVHVGTGATIIQAVVIGQDSVIGAGSVVIDNISSNTEVMGVPAKKVVRNI